MVRTPGPFGISEILSIPKLKRSSAILYFGCRPENWWEFSLSRERNTAAVTFEIPWLCIINTRTVHSLKLMELIACVLSWALTNWILIWVFFFSYGIYIHCSGNGAADNTIMNVVGSCSSTASDVNKCSIMWGRSSCSATDALACRCCSSSSRCQTTDRSCGSG